MKEHRFKWGLLLGLGLGSVAGLLVYMYLWRRELRWLASKADEQPVQGAAMPMINPPPIIVPPRPLPEAIDEGPPIPDRGRANSTIRSYALPAPGQDAIRLVSSSDRPYTVMVRVVDPPGAFAMFSFDASVLNNVVAIPTGENIIIPVGQWQTVTIPPHSALYGRGSVANVTASITGTPV